VGEGAGQKTAAGKMKNSRARPKRRSNFSQRKIFVVHRTTRVLQCHFRARRNTFESFIA
jgi:hypothetical protein